jgi:hypothetical protein
MPGPHTSAIEYKQMLYGGAPYKSLKIAKQSRRLQRPRGSLAASGARVGARTHIVQNSVIPGKSATSADLREVQLDLQGSLIVLLTLT